MAGEERESLRLLTITSADELEQCNSRVIFNTSPSVISYENLNIPPKTIIDLLDEIYSDRTHRKCLYFSYLTLLSMTLAIGFWIFHWIAYNRCKNTNDHELELFLCDLSIILETITFILVGITPILFIIMILSWINYSCHNPMDSIRENNKLFLIEGNQWKEQLKYYYTKEKFRYMNCFRRKQRKELNDRGYGYIILSSHGIVIDELILLSARKNIIDHGILSDDKKLLKLTFKKTCTRPWKICISIYLPEDPNSQSDIEQIMRLLNIQNNDNTVISTSF